MPQMSFKRNGPNDIWVLEGPFNAAFAYHLAIPELKVEWFDGAVDGLATKVAMADGSPHIDFSDGLLYVVYFIKGTVGTWCTPMTVALNTLIDATMDTVTGGATWGIEAWMDEYGIHDWQQY